MKWFLFFAAWLVISALVCWMAGRFIRIGMTELQPQKEIDE